MGTDTRLFWSALATGQYLEADPSVREQIDVCVDLIGQFPLIGVRMASEGLDHRRRFVCAGFRIVYDLKETRLVDMNPETTGSENDGAAERFDITIMRFKRV